MFRVLPPFLFRFRFLIPFIFLFPLSLPAQSISLLPGERWWGGRTKDAPEMPFQPGYTADLADNRGNQVQPLLLSNKGRYVWCEETFEFTLTDSTLEVSSNFAKVQYGGFGKNLPETYQFAAENLFPFQGKIPHELLFTAPQYNTWIELIYNQNQADILTYAQGIIDAGFPPGILMIDDNWQRDYGNWNFRPDRFPDPKGMIDQLHGMGFKVMLWICPFVSADSELFRYLYEEKDAFVHDPNYPKEALMVRWWNGFSAMLDFTHPPADAWFRGELDRLQNEFGVDGFKLDAGDFPFYKWAVPHAKNTLPHRQSQAFARIGLDYPMNEYRACFRMGGEPLAQRLHDKSFNWEDLQKLVPSMTIMGLMGYPFACPDMIGGGEYRSFLALDKIDQELIVRSAQVHALMPMMQFSVAPWRVLDKEHLAAAKKAALLHQEYGDHILQLAKIAAVNGTPIVQPMAFAFPDQSYEMVKDQFMLGEDILVAPVTKSGARSREVLLPPGKWKYIPTGEIFKGPGQVEVAAPLDVLPYFKLR